MSGHDHAGLDRGPLLPPADHFVDVQAGCGGDVREVRAGSQGGVDHRRLPPGPPRDRSRGQGQLGELVVACRRERTSGCVVVEVDEDLVGVDLLGFGEPGWWRNRPVHRRSSFATYTWRSDTVRTKTAYASVSETLALVSDSCNSAISVVTNSWRTALCGGKCSPALTAEARVTGLSRRRIMLIGHRREPVTWSNLPAADHRQ